MPDFKILPGQRVTQVKLKNDSLVDICYPKWQDLESLLDYINTISAEDTFITVSGEQFTIDEEAGYLSRIIGSLNSGTGTTLFALDKGKVVGVSSINKTYPNRIRATHRTRLGISIAKEYRGLGLGRQLISKTIAQAKARITGMKIIELDAFEINTAAINLYKSLGFKIVGKVEKALFYKGNYENELIMTLDV